MALKNSCLIVLCLFTTALTKLTRVLSNHSFVNIDTGLGSEEELQQVFERSEEAHEESMRAIMKTLTMEKAMEVLESVAPKDPRLQDVANVFSSRALQAKVHFRKKRQPAGYTGLSGARQLLNDMIFEAMLKYDEEIAKCTDYYAKQCALMEVARGEISAANFIAANSRMLILDAQQNINACEQDIPKTKHDLAQHNSQCKNELQKMNTRLKIVMGDIAVMTMILKMTDCETAFLQQHGIEIVQCEDPCTHKSFVTFKHDGLQQEVKRLKSRLSKELMTATFNDLFKGIQSLESYESQEPAINKTEFNNPPIPRTKVPGNPCIDPNNGAPSPEDKRAAKCTIKKSPQCYKLQERFLLIQAGIADERDQLMADIATTKADCEETQQTLQTAIANDESLLDSSQTKLAFATEKEASAGEKARVVAKQNAEYNEDLLKQMKKCSTNYIDYETQLCALKKIRGELYKMKGDGHDGFFQDCEVSPWSPEDCTKKCAGGVQKLSRNVLTHPNGGAQCLPLAAVRSCSTMPCPVDCKQEVWSGWSKCSADCGGGVQQRVRDIKVAMRYNGKPCGKQKESKACNVAACEKDCELSDWTAWTSCSKDCDGGTAKRSKFVSAAAEGSGKCPGTWSEARLQYKPCRMHRCKVPEHQALYCNRTVDVILLIDACPKGGAASWTAQIQAANTFLDSLNPDKAHVAAITYCGPRTWSGVSQCTGKSTEKIDTEKVCKVKIIQHFTNDLTKAKTLINGLAMIKGMKLMSLAFLAAKSELALGRKNAQSVVVGFIDGPPLSIRKTEIAAKVLRKSSRLLLVPTVQFSPLAALKRFVTRRWQENLVVIRRPEDLANPVQVTHINANICPAETPILENSHSKGGV
mmetsp:Transcript_29454/g.47374  ORF Transcript_29454/g.47374 Transcript_29454/m.47374 type:complete len:867 (-) Transcript_29454:66-2666(-)